MDWHRLFFEQGGYGRLDAIARRRFPDENIAGQAFNQAFEELSKDGYSRLSGYTRISLPGTYVTVIFNRLLVDFSRGKFGRPRPPARLVRRFGDLGKAVFQRLCLERWEPETIVDWLCARKEPATQGRARDNVCRIIATFVFTFLRMAAFRTLCLLVGMTALSFFLRMAAFGLVAWADTTGTTMRQRKISSPYEDDGRD